MPSPPNLLNDDGAASIATALMMSHHGFRRDLARFSAALEGQAPAKAAALHEEWQSFHKHLYGHHDAEDHGIFPSLLGKAASLQPIIDELTADHRLIDPLLARGDHAFAMLEATAGAAVAVVRELEALLIPHLATEEAQIVPFLRSAKQFPLPPDDAALALYVEGFAWAMQGIAPDVVEQLCAILPDGLVSRLPAERDAFQTRCDRVWGPLPARAARTPIPV